MMSTTARVLATASLLVLTSSWVQADGVFLKFEAGLGDIDVDNTGQLPFDPIGDAGDNALASSIGVGYQFASGAYVDLAATNLDAVSLFGFSDAFELSAIKLGVGYHLHANETFSFLGKIGASFWELDAKESFLFNPGPEESRSINGTDLFFEIGGQYRINERIALTLTHSRHAYDLGDTTSTRLGIKVYLGQR